MNHTDSLLLAIDGSTPSTVLALGRGERVLAEVSVDGGGKHSRDLLELADRLMALVGWERKTPDALVVGIGPGSFTGIRVAMATAKGVAMGAERLLCGVSGLEVLARNAPYCSVPVVACLDARKSEVYCRTYDCSGGEPRGLDVERVLSPARLAEELAQKSEEVLLLGSGLERYRELFSGELGGLLKEAPAGLHRLRGANMLAAAVAEGGAGFREPELVRATYIRPSEAELHVGPPDGGPPLKGRIEADGSIREP